MLRGRRAGDGRAARAALEPEPVRRDEHQRARWPTRSVSNFAAVGRNVPAAEMPRPLGSTDMGNVSKVSPGSIRRSRSRRPDVNGALTAVRRVRRVRGRAAGRYGCGEGAGDDGDRCADGRGAAGADARRIRAGARGLMQTEPYGSGEFAELYDLAFGHGGDDVEMYEQFARRGETPSLELGVGSGPRRAASRAQRARRRRRRLIAGDAGALASVARSATRRACGWSRRTCATSTSAASGSTWCTAQGTHSSIC